jgi:hypothetical protein
VRPGFAASNVIRSSERFLSSLPKSGSGAAVRDVEFFDRWSKQRVYFYQVDLRGRLFLDSPNLARRNDATCLKSREFLDFFFKRVRPCPEEVSSVKSESWQSALLLFSSEYPFMSPCGKELNLVKAEDTPIVFRDLVEGLDGQHDELVYAGSLREAFDPSRLFVGRETERIYYTKHTGERCLVHADLAQRLSKGFSPESEGWWVYKGARYVLETK